jgi:hypothetical protein
MFTFEGRCPALIRFGLPAPDRVKPIDALLFAICIIPDAILPFPEFGCLLGVSAISITWPAATLFASFTDGSRI